MEMRALTTPLAIKTALELVWEVFTEFEAPDYSTQGANEFKGFLEEQEKLTQLQFFGAFSDDEIVGVLAMRDAHISLLFVRKTFHRRGIARALFEHMLSQTAHDVITVNAAPYATEIYHRLGFADTNIEQTTNGIRYTPMVWRNTSCIS